MAIAVASTTTATQNETSTLVINKPTGVASGDLLVIVAAASSNTTSVTGFTKEITGNRTGGGLDWFYRIADSTDVSASTYSITGGGNLLGSAVMMRITGWSTGNPFFGEYVHTDVDDVSNVVTITQTVLRPVQQLLIMGIIRPHTNNSATFSTYQVTSSDANPSWTEVIDTTAQVSAGGADINFALAYAVTSNTSNISAWGYNVSLTAGNHLAALAVICEPTSQTTDLSHLAVTPTVEGITASSVNVVTILDHNPVVPVVNGLPTVATAPTQWTNETKPSDTSWSNESKY